MEEKCRRNEEDGKTEEIMNRVRTDGDGPGGMQQSGTLILFKDVMNVSKAATMLNLLNWSFVLFQLRQSQSYCTDNECIQERKPPSFYLVSMHSSFMLSVLMTTCDLIQRATVFV